MEYSLYDIYKMLLSHRLMKLNIITQVGKMSIFAYIFLNDNPIKH